MGLRTITHFDFSTTMKDFFFSTNDILVSLVTHFSTLWPIFCRNSYILKKYVRFFNHQIWKQIFQICCCMQIEFDRNRKTMNLENLSQSSVAFISLTVLLVCGSIFFNFLKMTLKSWLVILNLQIGFILHINLCRDSFDICSKHFCTSQISVLERLNHCNQFLK